MELDELGEALGCLHGTKFEILRQLLHYPATPSELASDLGISEPGVQRQLKEMLGQQIIVRIAHGRSVKYGVDFLRVRAVAMGLLDLLGHFGLEKHNGNAER